MKKELTEVTKAMLKSYSESLAKKGMDMPEKLIICTNIQDILKDYDPELSLAFDDFINAVTSTVVKAVPNLFNPNKGHLEPTYRSRIPTANEEATLDALLAGLNVLISQ